MLLKSVKKNPDPQHWHRQSRISHFNRTESIRIRNSCRTSIAIHSYTKSETPVPVRTLGPRLPIGWGTIQGLDVDVVASNILYCKSQKWR